MEKQKTIDSVVFVLCGTILQLFNGLWGGMIFSILSIVGVVLLFVGLSQLKQGIDEKGQAGVKMIITAIIVSLVGFVIDIIPLLGWLAKIVLIVAFILEFIGYSRLALSDSLGETGKEGAKWLKIAMILMIVRYVIGLIPLLGAVIGAIISVVALVFVILGWIKVRQGLKETL